MLITIAQLQQNLNKSNRANLQTVLEVLTKAEVEANKLISDIQIAISEHEAAGKLLQEEAAAHGKAAESLADMDVDEAPSKGKGKARDIEERNINGDNDDDELPHNSAGEEHRIKRRALQQRLRECQITLHRVRFLKGDAHHSLGLTKEETADYAAAEELRRILLKS
jgi:E3 ubiquitin-protein ligase SHPRH